MRTRNPITEIEATEVSRSRPAELIESAGGINELDEVIKSIRKAKGEDAILTAEKIPLATHLPTGCFLLDFALMGGIPEGFPTMIYGMESSGKTTIIKHIVAEFHKKYPNKKAAWIDSEGMFDPDWAGKMGVVMDKLLLCRPEDGQEAVDLIDALMGAKEIGLIVLDSIPSCVPKTILSNSANDLTMGELARLMGIMCSKICMSYAKERKREHYVTIIMVNQWRSKLGLVFGDPRSLAGGRQINHIPTTKIELKNKEVMGKDKWGNEIVEHNEHSFKIAKAKHGSSIRSGEFVMQINDTNEAGLAQGQFVELPTVVMFAKKMGFITGGGASWKITGIDEKFSKLKDIETYLQANPDTAMMLKQGMLQTQRMDKGMPATPRDNYLLAPVPQ